MVYKVIKFFIGPFMKVLFQLETEGLENIPKEGPAILASNHFSFLDHFCCPQLWTVR